MAGIATKVTDDILKEAEKSLFSDTAKETTRATDATVVERNLSKEAYARTYRQLNAAEKAAEDATKAAAAKKAVEEQVARVAENMKKAPGYAQWKRMKQMQNPEAIPPEEFVGKTTADGKVVSTGVRPKGGGTAGETTRKTPAQVIEERRVRADYEKSIVRDAETVQESVPPDELEAYGLAGIVEAAEEVKGLGFPAQSFYETSAARLNKALADHGFEALDKAVKEYAVSRTEWDMSPVVKYAVRPLVDLVKWPFSAAYGRLTSNKLAAFTSERLGPAFKKFSKTVVFGDKTLGWYHPKNWTSTLGNMSLHTGMFIGAPANYLSFKYLFPASLMMKSPGKFAIGTAIQAAALWADYKIADATAKALAYGPDHWFNDNNSNTISETQTHTDRPVPVVSAPSSRQPELEAPHDPVAAGEQQPPVQTPSFDDYVLGVYMSDRPDESPLDLAISINTDRDSHNNGSTNLYSRALRDYNTTYANPQ